MGRTDPFVRTRGGRASRKCWMGREKKIFDGADFSRKMTSFCAHNPGGTGDDIAGFTRGAEVRSGGPVAPSGFKRAGLGPTSSVTSHAAAHAWNAAAARAGR